MIRLVFLLCLFATQLSAQTREVFPDQLDLAVNVEKTVADPYVGELVLVTIEGTYRRHITREVLMQPELSGFSWSQLGQDAWFEKTERGIKVKGFRRRMALFPDEHGDLEIPAFTHRLTLLDEQNKWFEHDIVSEPIKVKVVPKPQTEGWWLPVKRLQISDAWSNPPDQLKAGEGVLRMIRIEAVGVSPDFLPPMPELKSPSALIFPHPEKRLVELSPEGPISMAFWRWTIQPHQPPSAVLEPLEIEYYDTVHRKPRKAIISPQRIAYNDTELVPIALEPEVGNNRDLLARGAIFMAVLLGVGAVLFQREMDGIPAVLRKLGLDRQSRALARAARQGNVATARNAARALAGENPQAHAVLERFDASVYSPDAPQPDLRAFRRDLLKTL